MINEKDSKLTYIDSDIGCNDSSCIFSGASVHSSIGWFDVIDNERFVIIHYTHSSFKSSRKHVSKIELPIDLRFRVATHCTIQTNRLRCLHRYIGWLLSKNRKCCKTKIRLLLFYWPLSSKKSIFVASLTGNGDLKFLRISFAKIIRSNALIPSSMYMIHIGQMQS